MAQIALLGSTVAALIAARSLSARGIQVDVIRHSTSSPADWSRAVRAVHALGDVRWDADGFASALVEHLTGTRYDLLIPVDDVANVICAHYRELIGGAVPLAMPPNSVYERSCDKAITLALAQSAGVPVPHYDVVASMDELDRIVARSRTFPLYVKPFRSAILVNNRVNRLAVERVETGQELDAVCRSVIGRSPVMVQEAVPGHGIGVHLLADRGTILCMVQQNRLHEPPGGGPGSYRISSGVSPALRAYSERLVEALQWTGVAMIEYKGEVASDTHALMEVNGRLWRSLALTIRAGLDMPYLLYLLFCDRDRLRDHEGIEPRAGVRQRYLRADVGWIGRRLKRADRRAGVLWDWVKGLRHLAGGGEGLDIEAVRDPLPSVHDWSALWAKRVGRPLAAPLARRTARRRYHRAEASILHEVQHRLRGYRTRLLFVCLGNICRSPFAERYLQQRHGVPHVASAGCLPLEHRYSPRNVTDVARDHFAVDLSPHRSRCVSRELYDWADVVVAMDYGNLRDLDRLGLRGKPTLLLGSLDGGGAIPDPYGADEAATRRVLARMSGLLDVLAGRLRGSS